MKIAILTLRVDNNYGGHLQRYALMQVLKEMGHEPVVLFFRSTWVHDSPIVRFKKATKNLIKALIGRKHNPVMYWKHEDYRWEELRAFTFPFFEKNVVHSPLICSEQDLQKFVDSEKFDGFVVGSDQVWRKAYTQRWGVDHFFLDFAPKGTKRIAYAASFGLPDMEYDDDEIKRLAELYKQFDAVSVRENSGINILDRYGWTNPHAELVLDPTLLLPVEHYLSLIKNGNTEPSKGNMFCYILDTREEIITKINCLAEEKHLQPFFASIEGNNRMSVEQWLRSFDDAEYVVTNSYHGIVFALIFNKPFYLIENTTRGNARFTSLMEVFHLTAGENYTDCKKINKKIASLKDYSIEFLKYSLLK